MFFQVITINNCPVKINPQGTTAQRGPHHLWHSDPPKTPFKFHSVSTSNSVVNTSNRLSQLSSSVVDNHVILRPEDYTSIGHHPSHGGESDCFCRKSPSSLGIERRFRAKNKREKGQLLFHSKTIRPPTAALAGFVATCSRSLLNFPYYLWFSCFAALPGGRLTFLPESSDKPDEKLHLSMCGFTKKRRKKASNPLKSFQ